MKINNKYQLRNIADMLVLVPIEGEVSMHKVLTLNETGGFIWDYLKTEHTLEEILSSIASEYNVSVEDIRQDVSEYIEELVRAGAIDV